MSIDDLPVVRRVREKGFKALDKKPKYGPDLDVEKMIERRKAREPPSAVKEVAGETASLVGLDPERALSQGYVQVNETILIGPVLKKLEKLGVIILPTGEALKRMDEARKRYWGLLDPEEDKFTGAIAAYWRGNGYFIYVPPGVKVKDPVYACLFIAEQGYPQILHNIVIVDDDAELHLITGCATAKNVTRALHLSATEMYVGKRAKLTFTMIHSWAPQVHVRPRTAVRVSDEGSYTNYYVVFSKLASIQQLPRVELGKGASYTGVSVAVGRGSSVYDLGSEAVLGREASAEIISRTVAWDEAKMISRAGIHAAAPQSRGHIECTSLKLSPNSTVKAVPELSSDAEDADLSHEAAIGRVAEEELEYLMTRGMSEDEALSMILKGFLSVETPQLPEKVRRMVEATIKLLAEKGGL